MWGPLELLFAVGPLLVLAYVLWALTSLVRTATRIEAHLEALVDEARTR
jgi:hypothetical protein